MSSNTSSTSSESRPAKRHQYEKLAEEIAESKGFWRSREIIEDLCRDAPGGSRNPIEIESSPPPLEPIEEVKAHQEKHPIPQCNENFHGHTIASLPPLEVRACESTLHATHNVCTDCYDHAGSFLTSYEKYVEDHGAIVSLCFPCSNSFIGIHGSSHDSCSCPSTEIYGPDNTIRPMKWLCFECRQTHLWRAHMSREEWVLCAIGEGYLTQIQFPNPRIVDNEKFRLCPMCCGEFDPNYRDMTGVRTFTAVCLACEGFVVVNQRIDEDGMTRIESEFVEKEEDESRIDALAQEIQPINSEAFLFTLVDWADYVVENEMVEQGSNEGSVDAPISEVQPPKNEYPLFPQRDWAEVMRHQIYEGDTRIRDPQRRGNNYPLFTLPDWTGRVIGRRRQPKIEEIAPDEILLNKGALKINVPVHEIELVAPYGIILDNTTFLPRPDTIQQHSSLPRNLLHLPTEWQVPRHPSRTPYSSTYTPLVPRKFPYTKSELIEMRNYLETVSYNIWHERCFNCGSERHFTEECLEPSEMEKLERQIERAGRREEDARRKASEERVWKKRGPRENKKREEEEKRDRNVREEWEKKAERKRQWK